MIGIRNFNPAWFAILGFASAGSAWADEIDLTGRNSISGTIRSINESGVVELETPLSPDAVLLKAGAVEKVQFSPPKDSPETPAAVVQLVNGDLIPATVEGLDETNLTVSTLDCGRLVLPRTNVKSLQLGVHKRKIVYSGPKNLEEWLGNDDGGRNWKFENNALVATGPAYASKQCETPQQFIIQFTLKWQASPNFQIYFADPLKPRGEVSDRYYLQFNGAGLELKRESSKGNRYTTVLLLSNRTPDAFPENKLNVEIRVDRKTSRFHIFLNGEAEAAGIDPIPEPPTGKGITIVSNSPSGNDQEIREIQILAFDDARVRHRSEDRGDPKTDSMISRDDDRWSGHLTSVQNSADGLVFSFKSDFQEAPLELLESDVSTVFFAGAADAAKQATSNPFVLKLQENGILSVNSCSFTETTVSAVHPLLGQLTIRRAGIAAMERLNPNPKSEDAPEK